MLEQGVTTLVIHFSCTMKLHTATKRKWRKNNVNNSQIASCMNDVYVWAILFVNFMWKCLLMNKKTTQTHCICSFSSESSNLFIRHAFLMTQTNDAPLKNAPQIIPIHFSLNVAKMCTMHIDISSYTFSMSCSTNFNHNKSNDGNPAQHKRQRIVSWQQYDWRKITMLRKLIDCWGTEITFT